MAAALKPIDAILTQTDLMPDGPAKVELLGEAVRLADLSENVDNGFDARMRLINAASDAGRPDLMLVHYSWCLAQFDRHPGRFSAYSLMWRYKWVIDNAADFPQITRQQLADMMADQKRRYEAGGYARHAVWQTERRVALGLNDPKAARVAQGKVNRARPDAMSDCPACDLSLKVSVLTFAERYEEAVREAAPILAGRMACKSVPQTTYASLLYPLTRLGRLDEAAQYHRTGYGLIRTSHGFTGSFARHIRFLADTDNLTEGLQLLQRHLPNTLTDSPSARLSFLTACLLLLYRLQHVGRKELKLRLPAAVGCHRPDGKYPTAELLAWFEAESRDLGGRFDERNGNAWYAVHLAALPGRAANVTPYPLKAGSKKKGDVS